MPWSAEAPLPAVLTPARMSQPQSEVPGSVTVLDRELIQRSGARELAEVMRFVPGMQALNVDGNVPTVGYHPTLARDTRRMLVLIDGRSVYQPGLARVMWNNLPLDLADVERIEVSRGPSAASYGANAYTAVVNIVTRHPLDVTRTALAAETGSNGIHGLRAHQGLRWQDGALRWSLSEHGDRGYDHRDLIDGLRQHDSKRIRQGNLRLVYELDASNTVELWLGGAETRQQRPPEAGWSQFARWTDSRSDSHQNLFVQGRWQHQLSPEHQLQLQGYAQWSRTDDTLSLCALDPLTGQPGPGGGLLFSRELRDLFEAQGRDLNATLAALPGDAASVQRYQTLLASGAAPLCGRVDRGLQEGRLDLELQDTWQLHPRLRLVSGAQLRHDSADSEFYLGGQRDNRSHALFGQLEWRVLDPLLLHFGSFYQQDQINGRQLSPRAALVWRPAPGHGVRLVHSRAVRTVDLFEAHADYDIRLHGLSPAWRQQAAALLGDTQARLFLTQSADGSLQPEKIRASEIGYFMGKGPLVLDLRVFDEHLTSLITHPMNPVEFEAHNNDWVTHHGWEATLDLRPHWRHQLRLTAAEIRSRSSARAERRLAAHHSGSALWHWTLDPHWNLGLRYLRAQPLNTRRYEQLGAMLQYQQPLAAATTLQWTLSGEYSLSRDAVVFAENYYRERYRVWLGATLSF
ncbi:TonB-dependent receptor plug domain-containing protein [Isoalcanivorax beigongshangi]|uniref:TonB-dependent receptor plug domain-containing protein n=1 Tax=Isoalcanivorax beigongshangi TaxID=3238810 RepID=A0ABV4AJS5_9GAMM